LTALQKQIKPSYQNFGAPLELHAAPIRTNNCLQRIRYVTIIERNISIERSNIIACASVL
jgi:hypothetical protein